MRLLVVGSGGREHALVRRLLTDREVTDLVCAPGNPGIARIARTVPVNVARADDLKALARRERIDLTVVGPELPLSLGVADVFLEERRLLVGPTAAAARLESSKAFAKAFMARHDIPTARFITCDNIGTALDAVGSGVLGFPLVIKADGLAAGKGVVIAGDKGDAETAIADAMSAKRFGDAGARVVLEECLRGPEVSFFVVADGTRVAPIGSAQDHKRIFDDDRGPNTGGMGAFAQSPLMDAALSETVMRRIVEPVIAGMAAEGNEYRGFLYVGLMLTGDGPKVIEFNVRLGDPEAQVILPLIDEPLAPLLAASASGALTHQRAALSPDRAVGVVLASRGYPESADSGQPILGIDEAERLAQVFVYHAGTRLEGGTLVTAGGRVLTVVGQGDNFEEAIERAYAGVGCVSFDGMQHRRDIGRKAL